MRGKLDELVTGVGSLTRDEVQKLKNMLRRLEAGQSSGAKDYYTRSEVDAKLKRVDAYSLQGKRIGTRGNSIPVLDGKNEWSGGFELTGSAIVTEDLRIEPVARTTGANAPTFEKWYDDAAGTSRGVYLYSFDDAAGGSEKEIFFNVQLSHMWKEKTAIGLHVHWVGAVDDTTAEPRWGLEYAFKFVGQTFGDTTTIYTSSHVDGSGTADANVTAGKHYISPFADIIPDSTNDRISSVMICRLFRDSANVADTYNAASNKCGLLYIDAHIDINTLGSLQEYIK